MNLFVVGMSHKTAPVQLREQLAVPSSDLVRRASHVRLREDLHEIVLLSTCNRVEIYGTFSHRSRPTSSLLASLCPEPSDFKPHAYVHEDHEAARHLFRVASGLDSMVLGETEITGQVKKSYELARGAGLTGGVLNRAFQSAFQIAKEVRTRTAIGRGAASVGAVAVELAERIFRNDLSMQSVMIIGAGKMGEACVRHLVRKGVRSISVSNRSWGRAVELAGEFGGRAVPFEQRLPAMADADIVLVSTGLPGTLLQRAEVEELMAIRRNRPLALIDISVPRNIDPQVQELDNVYLYNIGDLNEIVCENVRHREQELALCDRIIDNGVAAVMAKLRPRSERAYGATRQVRFNWASESTAVVGA